MKENKKIKSIREQIMSGYFKMIIVIILLAITMTICLFWIRISYLTATKYQIICTESQTAIAGHYAWLENLNMSIQSGEEFVGAKNSDSCSLGKWMESSKQNNDQNLLDIMSVITDPHDNIHGLVEGILLERKENEASAYQRYLNDIVPQTKEVISLLEKMNLEYSEASNLASTTLMFAIMATIFILLIFVACAVVFAILYAKKSSSQISDSIVTVTNWAEKLSLGVDDLGFEEINESNQNLKEVNTLVKAFQFMASSIRDNVNVVKRVADGDMSAYVNIRSAKDSLGKNLYRMVQSNDALFHNIEEIAQTVSDSSNEIEKISELLSENVSIQENAILSLSESMETSSSLIANTNKKSLVAKEITQRLLSIAIESNKKMDNLVDSVNDITTASEQISTVIKSINSIAFQTNILSLNAAVESTRAGEAGKGFAVVAGEVRTLASKSAQAAKESALLIKDTIEKASSGSENAIETAEVFRTMVDEIKQIVTIINDVTSSSEEQLKGVEIVNQEISQIAEVTEHNATISSQSENSSKEMRNHAELLRQAMSNFNLRQRKEGDPYIPTEKKNDKDFIAYATDAYKSSKETGGYGKEYITPKI